MLDELLAYLACPYCAGVLTRGGRTLRCPAGHAFDIARHGYVNLLPGDAKPGGDTLAMVEARERFLATGHYAAVSDALGDVASGATGPGCVVDVGSGPGHHLAHVLERVPGRVGVALDRSKYAMRRAARAHARVGAAACDTWRGLPVRDGAARILLNVFAPRNGAEFRRVLAPGGALVVVTPTGRHLAELVGPLELLTVDTAKDDRVEAVLGPYFSLHESRVHEETAKLTHREARDLVLMGPNAYHVDPSDLDRRLNALPGSFPVTVSVIVSVYHRRGT